MPKTYLTGGCVLPLRAGFRGTVSREMYDPGVVVFEDGRITFAGPAGSVSPQAGGAGAAPDDAAVINCSGLFVLPGLVNAHTHTGMSYLRNLLEDLPSPTWFERELLAERSLTSEDIYWSALLGAYEMVRQGVTTIADRFSQMGVIVKALEKAGVRAVVAPSLVDRDGAARQAQALDVLAQYGAAHEGLIHAGLGPVGPDSCGTEMLRWTRDQADRHGARIFIHVAQSRQELAEVARRGYHGSVRYLDEIGCLGPDVVAAHCMFVDDEEIELLAQRGVSVAHCPSSNAKIEGRVAPIRAMEEAGVSVGLGTDSGASNNGMDLFQEMRTAGLLHKVAAGDPLGMPVDRLLFLATGGAAQCLGLEGDVGSLEAGKRADIITVRRDSAWLQPWHDPFAGLVYAARGLDVQDVWIEGRRRVAGGALLAGDVGEAVERAERWATRLRQQDFR